MPRRDLPFLLTLLMGIVLICLMPLVRFSRRAINDTESRSLRRHSMHSSPFDVSLGAIGPLSGSHSSQMVILDEDNAVLTHSDYETGVLVGLACSNYGAIFGLVRATKEQWSGPRRPGDSVFKSLKDVAICDDLDEIQSPDTAAFKYKLEADALSGAPRFGADETLPRGLAQDLTTCANKLFLELTPKVSVSLDYGVFPNPLEDGTSLVVVHGDSLSTTRLVNMDADATCMSKTPMEKMVSEIFRTAYFLRSFSEDRVLPQLARDSWAGRLQKEPVS